MAEAMAAVVNDGQNLGELLRVVRRDLDRLKTMVYRLLSELEARNVSYDGYTLTYTWVLNKVGKKYYYYYLKSKTRKPTSIYIGKTIDSGLLKYRGYNLKQFIKELNRLLRGILTLESQLSIIQTTASLLEMIKKREEGEE
ncbi:hypothetical protein J4526_01880 [Desulfurococcaceae archaeon MEX13E-LK6-19]|nr:hypothetical protein J4526_01880 [Desulfurococcaceae archaeon MEX13E-LK6-19]